MNRTTRNHPLPAFHDDRLHPVCQAGGKHANWKIRIDVEAFGRTVSGGYLDNAVITAGQNLAIVRRELLKDLPSDALQPRPPHVRRPEDGGKLMNQ